MPSALAAPASQTTHFFSSVICAGIDQSQVLAPEMRSPRLGAASCCGAASCWAAAGASGTASSAVAAVVVIGTSAPSTRAPEPRATAVARKRDGIGTPSLATTYSATGAVATGMDEPVGEICVVSPQVGKMSDLGP